MNTFIFVTGKNIRLRSLGERDVDVFFSGLNNIPALEDYIMPQPIPKYKIEELIKSQGFEDPLVMLIEKNYPTEPIGYIQCSNYKSQNGFTGDLDGLIWRPEERGKGYFTEALKLFVKFVFVTSNLNRLQAIVPAGNKAAEKTLLNANFKEEGILRQYKLVKGRFQDFKVFSILREEFLSYEAKGLWQTT